MVRYKKRPRLWPSDDNTSSSETDTPPPKKIMKTHCSFCENADVKQPVGTKRSQVDGKRNGPSCEPQCEPKRESTETVEVSKYEKWNAKVDTAEFLPWYRSRELVCTLRYIRKINYTDSKCRTAALDRLNKLNDAAPFTKYRRFPENYYILEGDGVLAKKLQQLRCMLEMTYDSSQDKKECSPDNMCRMFRNCCRMIMSELVKGDDVYDRKKFEKCFDVAWIEAKPRPKPDTEKKNSSVKQSFSDEEDGTENSCKKCKSTR